MLAPTAALSLLTLGPPAQAGTYVRDGVDFRVRFSNLRHEYEPLVAHHAF
ncbi:hypothetical protein [Micromonospora sp. IBHARD004]